MGAYQGHRRDAVGRQVDVEPDPPYIQFEHLSAVEGLVHGIFSRRGGVSTAPFDSLNTSLSVGDDPHRVRVNRRRIRRALKAPVLVYPSQVHGLGVVKITSRTAVSAAPRADALVTRCPGIFLGIQVADCQAVLVVDPVRGVIANIHAGWRGTVHNIIGRTIGTMHQEYGCRPGDLRAGIGPSLGPCCAEFVNYRREIPKRYWPYKSLHQHFDFWAITRDQLVAEGVSVNQIAACKLCTRCHTDRFFSYRQAKITGRFSAVIGLR